MRFRKESTFSETSGAYVPKRRLPFSVTGTYHAGTKITYSEMPASYYTGKKITFSEKA